MQRDYILRLIDQVGQFLAKVVLQRKQNSPHEALQNVMAGCERLFAIDAVELFRFTPEQHVAMLADGESPDIARDKILIYAALNAEAGRCFALLGRAEQSRNSTLLALRLTLKARADYGAEAWPDFAPKTAELIQALGATPLDEETAGLLDANG
jgi:hypothetical protein